MRLLGNRVLMGRAAAAGKRAASGRPARPIRRLRDAGPGDDRQAADGHEADLDAYIARLVDAAPPLTGEQRDTLALILRGQHRR